MPSRVVSPGLLPLDEITKPPAEWMLTYHSPDSLATCRRIESVDTWNRCEWHFLAQACADCVQDHVRLKLCRRNTLRTTPWMYPKSTATNVVNARFAVRTHMHKSSSTLFLDVHNPFSIQA